MALTRNSHSLTSLNLPDATMALFLIGGFYLKDLRWFASLFLISTLIDAITSYIDPSMNLWHNISYLGMIFAYGAMWLGGFLAIKVKSFFYLFIISMVSSITAFIISTQTYNLLSGTFPDITIKQSMQTGWEYLPQSLIYTMSYLMAYWAIQSLLKKQFASQKASFL
jgi:hypothetical protein